MRKMLAAVALAGATLATVATGTAHANPQDQQCFRDDPTKGNHPSNLIGWPTFQPARLARFSTGINTTGPDRVNAALSRAERRKGHLRNILERRAQENGIDFVKGVATAITPMAFFETVMVKGYETLVDPDTAVDVNTGMIAAARLQALIETRASGTSIADLMAQMDRIIRVIHSTVPQGLWPEILRKIDGPVAADTPADEFEDYDHAEDEYEPAESAEADEDCWTPCARRA